MDPLLIAGRCVPDAIIVNHSALEFHGLAYSQFQTFTFQTRYSARRFDYHAHRFVPLSPPGSLKRTSNDCLETMTGERFGLPVTVSTIERTLVDAINTPRWSGSWEEISRSLDSIESCRSGVCRRTRLGGTHVTLSLETHGAFFTRAHAFKDFFGEVNLFEFGKMFGDRFADENRYVSRSDGLRSTAFEPTP